MAVTNDHVSATAKPNPSSGVESHLGTPATKLALSLCHHDAVGVHSREECSITGVHRVTRMGVHRVTGGVPEGRT